MILRLALFGPFCKTTVTCGVHGCQHVALPGMVVEGDPQSRLVAPATRYLVANGVDANADAVLDFMNAKSMIGSMPASAYRE